MQVQTAHLRQDALAALVVALVTIPASFAYAELAGLPPLAGLLAAVGGMVAYALCTSSRHVVVGPDAAIALLVGAAIGPLAGGDPGAAILLAAALAALTGALLLLMARLNLGIAADFLSSPAMLGFMNGAAVVIVASQLGKLCGIRLDEDNALLRLWEFAARLGETHAPTLAIGLAVLALLALCRWRLPRVPGAVVVFLLAMLGGTLFDAAAAGVAVIGRVELALPALSGAGFGPAALAPLFTAALGTSLLIFSEGVLLGRSVASRHGYGIDPDRELVAFGIANVAAAALLAFPVGSSQTRTLLNDATGGRTQAVSLIAAAGIAVFVLLLSGWIATIPSVAIAAILVFAGVTLVDLAAYRRLWRQKQRFGTVVAVSTTVGVLALGVLPGILLGVVLSLLGALAQVVRPQDALLGCVEGSETLHDIGDDERATTIPGLVVYRFYGPLIFANVRYFIERVEAFIEAEEHPVRELIVDARAISDIDVTAAEELRAFFGRLRGRGITAAVAKAHLPLRESLQALGSGDVFGAGRQYEQLADAVADFRLRAAPPLIHNPDRSPDR